MPIKFDAQLEKLLMESQTADRISAELPRARVEIAVSLTDSSQGFFSLDVEGFAAEEGRSLRARYDAALSAWLRCGELWDEAKKAAQAKAASPEEAQLAALEVASDSRFVLANDKLSHALGMVCEEIIRRAVYGWPAREFLIPDGQGGTREIEPIFDEIPLVTGPRRLLRPVLAAQIAAQGRALRIVSQIFRVSRGDAPQTALEQWAEGAKFAREEAAKASPPKAESAPEAHAAAPFEPKQKRPVRTPKGSPSRNPSPSPSESENASLLAKESTPKVTDSEATTAPLVPTSKNSPVDAALTGAQPAQAEPSESTTTSPHE